MGGHSILLDARPFVYEHVIDRESHPSLSGVLVIEVDTNLIVAVFSVPDARHSSWTCLANGDRVVAGLEPCSVLTL